MIWKTQDFETGLSNWFECTSVEHTWHIFKTHFTAAHNALKLIIGSTLCNTEYH